MHRIIVEFPTEEMKEEFCGQLSDGWGENYCNFMPVFEYYNGKAVNTAIDDAKDAELYEVTWVEQF